MRFISLFQFVILTLLLLSYFSGVKAQVNKVFSNPEMALAPTFVSYSDKFVLQGTYIVGSGFQILYLLKTDSVFNNIQYKIFTDSVNSRFAGYKNLVKINTGFVTAFGTYDSLGNVITGLIFLDENLGIQNIRYFSSTTGYFAGLNLTKHPDGGLIITGNVNETPPVAEDIFLLRTDSLGNELWRRTYGLPGVNESPGRAFHIQGEEYFVPYGKRFNYQDGVFCFGGYLLKYNHSNLAFSSKKFHRDWQCESAMNYMVKLNDGNFLGVSGMTNGSATETDYYVPRYGRITKIDSNMNVIFDTPVGEDNYFDAGFIFFDTLTNNELFIGGSIGEQNDNIFQYSRAWILKYRLDGNILWQRKYYYYSNAGAEHVKYDFLRTNDGGIALCGYAMDAGGPQQIWVVKTDSFGCVVPGCQMYDGLENPPELLSMQIYPNPAQDFLNIFLPPGKDREDVRIYDMQGKMVQSLRLLPAATTTMLNIRNLAPGMYFLSHQGEAFKFVKE